MAAPVPEQLQQAQAALMTAAPQAQLVAVASQAALMGPPAQAALMAPAAQAQLMAAASQAPDLAKQLLLASLRRLVEGVAPRAQARILQRQAFAAW